jgi:hypothetical protein
MKIVLHKEGRVLDVKAECENISVSADGRSFNWDKGSFEGLAEGIEFLIVDEDVIVEDGVEVTPEILAANKYNLVDFLDSKGKLEKENAELKDKLARAESDNLVALSAITELYEMILGG